MVAGTNLLGHIAVLLFDLQLYGSCPVFFIHLFFNPAQILFFCCKLLCIVITDDIFRLGMCYITAHSGQVIEAFVSVCVSRRLCFRQERLNLARYSNRINHRIFRTARVNIKSGHGKFCTGCIKVFELDLSLCPTVYGISKFCIESRNIEEVSTFSNLFIRCKGDGNLPMWKFSGKKRFCQRHNLCYSCLIICTEYRRSIACNQRFTGQGCKMRKYRSLQRSAAFRQFQILSVIIFMNHRVYSMVRKIRYGIHMGDKPDSRCFPFHSRRYNSHHIAEFIQFHLLDTYSFHLFLQYMGKLHLSRCTGIQSRIRV